MLAKRIIACLDVRDGCVVKGVQFQELAAAGDPAALARRYNAEGIDELVILDVTATIENRRALAETIRRVSAELFIPLAVGGGIRSEADAEAALDAGADKVALNSAAIADPSLVTRLARRYGSQAVVVAIDARRGPSTGSGAQGDGDCYAVFSRSGSTETGRDAVAWAREAAAAGAGEILLTSIDGGAGTFDHFVDVFTRGRADAALAASVFHFSEHAVADLKLHLDQRGVPVRRVPC
jgi:cyclase